ncbi:MAG: PCMD domain-containing protein [Rikenellaceae bacterium]
MRKLKLLSIVAIFLMGLTQCVDEKYFGESQKADIVKFTIEGELSNKIEPLVDNKDVGTVNITVPEKFDLKDLKVTMVKSSQLSHFKTDPLVITDFSAPVELILIAENGAEKKWVVTVTKDVVKVNEQLLFSSMSQWTTKNNQGISPVLGNKMQGMYPGDGVGVSPWTSTIESNAFGGSYFESFSTYAHDLKAGAGKVARIETIRGTAATELMSMGVATGALFTGEFIFNSSLVLGSVKEPRKMMNYGVAFHSKPKAVKFKIRYVPGDVMKDGKGVDITVDNAAGRPTKDGCDIYFILQNRHSEPGKYTRVAAASYRSVRGEKIGDMSDDVNGFVTMEIPFIYGKPSAADLAAKNYCGIGGENGEITFFNFAPKGNGSYDVSKDPITEEYSVDPTVAEVDTIIGSFSSSISGDLFFAAPGSTIDVKDIEFVY